VAPAHAAIHLSHERYAELPSSWKGFLADLRALRVVGMPPSPQTPPSSLRQEYAVTVERLQAAAKARPLLATESADLGALLIRLNKLEPALTVLREAVRKHPDSFALHANLGVAWQLSGDLGQAAEHLRLAVDLAPAEHKPLEELHLRVVRQRVQKGQGGGLDDIFGIAFVDATGQHRLGKLTAAERSKLPRNAVALVQQLALSFPNDGWLLWQLSELAMCYGDLSGAAMLLDLCVGEYGLGDRSLRHSRQALQVALDARGELPIGQASQQQAHTSHSSTLVFKSRRPLVPRPLDVRHLPAVVKGQSHHVSWPLLAETATDPRRFKPTFHAYLRQLEGEKISLTGFMQPLTDDLECTSFILVENPIGCWYCEMPDLTGIVVVTVPAGKTTKFTRNVIKVTGVLKLNGTDPEDFLFSVSEATVGVPD
jgi:hypothetical protein